MPRPVLYGLANQIKEKIVGTWTSESLPQLRGLYERISKLETWKRFAPEVTGFGRALEQAEAISRFYRGVTPDRQPPELARAMALLQHAMDELHAAVETERRHLESENRRYAATEASSSPNRRSTIHSALKGI